jgi:hypothetical protein
MHWGSGFLANKWLRNRTSTASIGHRDVDAVRDPCLHTSTGFGGDSLNGGVRRGQRPRRIAAKDCWSHALSTGTCGNAYCADRSGFATSGCVADFGRLTNSENEKMIDWPLAFSTLSQAFKAANDLRSIDKEVSQAELKLKVADLTSSLAGLKMTLTDAKVEAAEKDAEIVRLKEVGRRVVEETVEVDGYRYRKRIDGEEGVTGKPFCNVCLQKDGLLIETTYAHGSGLKGSVSLQCPNCKAWYGLDIY